MIVANLAAATKMTNLTDQNAWYIICVFSYLKVSALDAATFGAEM